LLQIARGRGERRLGLVDSQRVRLLGGIQSIYELAKEALRSSDSLAAAARQRLTTEELDYDPLYAGTSEWRILPAADHPQEPARCLVSGTGLTHTASAKNRNAMHAVDENPTDSMRMFRWGVEGGRPVSGQIGVEPEWFYKGCGTVLRGHGEPLEMPPHAVDGGEEPEIAGVYVIDDDGGPRRLGMAVANEFSDHRLEKKNYLYLASSKLRTCAIGPELVVDPDFTNVPGEVSIERGGTVIWSKQIASGEESMCHSLANLEHHHFKHQSHRRPGDVHIHFFGADAFSFGEGLVLEDGDTMQVRFEGFGRALRNPLRIDRSAQRHFAAAPL
jgi:hypothetical protein